MQQSLIWAIATIFFVGTNFSTVSSNLAAGYSVSLQSNTYGTDTSRQTISVVVADDMEYESIASFSETSTSTITADFLDGSNWSKIFPQSDVRDITWSDASGSGVATLVTQGPHGLTTGSQVDIFGTGGFDQSAAVVTVVDATTLTYALIDNPGSYASGGSRNRLFFYDDRSVYRDLFKRNKLGNRRDNVGTWIPDG